MGKWLALIAGPQPVLRLIALLLAIIAALLVVICREVHAIYLLPPPDICGTGPSASPLGLSAPCKVEIVPQRGY